MNVMKRQCATCIYRKDSNLDVKGLESQVADPRMDGFFESYRQCHHGTQKNKACCRGFWNRHKNHFTLGQIAQRLGFVKYVKEGNGRNN